MKKRILFLTVGDDCAASSRIRSGWPMKILEAYGWQCRRIISKGRSWPLKLLVNELCLRRPLVVVQKVCPPRILTFLIRIMSSTLVYEIDDAIYMGYPGMPPMTAVKNSRRINYICAKADRVTTSNELIRSDLGLVGSPKATVFPGPAPVIDLEYKAQDKDGSVLWLGSPSTFENFSIQILPAAPLVSELRLVALGAALDSEANGVTFRKWSLERQREELNRATVGLMPLEANAWNKRKAAYKVLEYLAAGIIPVLVPSAAVETLLGKDAPILCQLIEGDEPRQWAGGILKASAMTRTDDWYAARSRVFERWSVQQFAKTIIGRNELKK